MENENLDKIPVPTLFNWTSMCVLFLSFFVMIYIQWNLDESKKTEILIIMEFFLDPLIRALSQNDKKFKILFFSYIYTIGYRIDK